MFCLYGLNALVVGFWGSYVFMGVIGAGFLGVHDSMAIEYAIIRPESAGERERRGLD